MNKKNLILGGVLIILIAIAYLYQGPIKDWRQSLGKPDNFLAIVDINQINKIEIIKNGETTVLEKMGDPSASSGQGWKIGGTKDFYVKQDLADSLKNGLNEAVEADIELASGNKEKKSDFQTDLESGVNVKLSQGDGIVADFVVGKRGVDFTSAYISEPESDNTYIIAADISGVFSHGDWYDKTIFSTDKEKISKIRFQYPNREFTIEAVADKKIAEEGAENIEITKIWEGVLPYKFSVDKEKIDKILNIMSNLTAVEIPEQIFENTGLEKNLIIAQATGEGIDNTLMIGDVYKTAEEDEGLRNGSTASAEAGDYGAIAGEELYYAKRGYSDNIYLITKEQRDELDKRIRDLR